VSALQLTLQRAGKSYALTAESVLRVVPMSQVELLTIGPLATGIAAGYAVVVREPDTTFTAEPEESRRSRSATLHERPADYLVITKSNGDLREAYWADRIDWSANEPD